MVKAKFRLVSVTNHDAVDQRQVEVKLLPVQADEGEDSIFGKYTPTGEIRLYLIDTPAIDVFTSRLGKPFYVDLVPAEE